MPNDGCSGVGYPPLLWIPCCPRYPNPKIPYPLDTLPQDTLTPGYPTPILEWTWCEGPGRILYQRYPTPSRGQTDTCENITLPVD